MKCLHWILVIIVGIAWIAVYFGFLIKLPFYLYINNIKLPEDCSHLETNVIITDLPTWQIVADRLVYTTIGEEEIREYIDKGNRNSEKIEVADFFEWNNREYDGYATAISPEKYAYVEGEDKGNYIVLEYASNMHGGHLYEIMCLLGILMVIVICCLMCKLGRTWEVK